MSNIPKKVQRRVRARARDRCGYCISSQKYILGLLEMEHIHPEALGGTDDEENLWLACRLCNGFKGIQTHGAIRLRGAASNSSIRAVNNGNAISPGAPMARASSD
jgi:5-methylcytosine-specific restriction endonuclease McrA